MPAPQIDLESVANAVTAVLNQRASEAQAARQAAERETTLRSQREADEAAEAARIQREERQKLVARLENEQCNCHDHCVVLEQQLRELPDRIASERARLNNLLYRLSEAKKGL